MESAVQRAGNVELPPWWRRAELALLALLVIGIYFTRITAQPIVGEEGRWARGAVQMIQWGDWIVLRQQGQVFPERPPMSSWLMALVGLARGQVDDLAVRLPSVLAILATAVTIYFYAATFLSRWSAFAAGAVYATMGQVLQIGRMGESEAVFTMFLSASLLIWHLGYVRGWPKAVVWSVGYALAALAALAKGPQAPIYFAAATGLFLVLRRDWRWIFSWPHAVGVGAFVVVVGAWQVPYFLMTDWASVKATWFGLASDRLTLSGVISHVVSFPVETFVCLLPWSPLLLLFARRRFRRSLSDTHTLLLFLVVALAVTYPSVWFASGARGRYFMPLYPCIAVLIGLVIQRCAEAAPDSLTRREWNRFVFYGALSIAGGGLVVAGASLLRIERLAAIHQPLWFAIVFAVSAAAAAAVMLWSRRQSGPAAVSIVVICVSAFVGLTYTGVVVNSLCNVGNNFRPVVAQIKGRLPDAEKLVSFGPVDHRFAYFYEAQIKEVSWPVTARDVPADVKYFCFCRRPYDTDAVRYDGRGRMHWTTAGTLPFAWEEVGTVCCQRRISDRPQPEVVVGRITGPSAVPVSIRPTETIRR